MARPCSVDDCERNSATRLGLCLMHYKRFRRTGTTSDPPPRPTKCSVDGCGNRHHCKGLCKLHYERVRKTGDTGPASVMVARNVGVPCSVDGCSRPANCKTMCAAHYSRVRKHGVTGTSLIKRKDGAGSIHPRSGYLLIRDGGRTRHAHRVKMERHIGRKLLPTEDVHHKNGNKLDNRIENLEIMLHSEHSRMHNSYAENNDSTKLCPQCGLVKPRAGFHRNSGRRDGLGVYCKPCWNQYIKGRAGTKSSASEALED